MLTNPPEGISASPSHPEDIKRWRGTIWGPPASLYAGAIFRLEMEFPTNYPLLPPKIKFLTKIFHPNIDKDTGAVCCDLLDVHWSSAASVRVILLSVQSLLTSPTATDANSPANLEAAALLRDDPAQFKDVVANYVEYVKINEGNYTDHPADIAKNAAKKHKKKKKSRRRSQVIEDDDHHHSDDDDDDHQMEFDIPTGNAANAGRGHDASFADIPSLEELPAPPPRPPAIVPDLDSLISGRSPLHGLPGFSSPLDFPGSGGIRSPGPHSAGGHFFNPDHPRGSGGGRSSPRGEFP